MSCVWDVGRCDSELRWWFAEGLAGDATWSDTITDSSDPVLALIELCLRSVSPPWRPSPNFLHITASPRCTGGTACGTAFLITSEKKMQ